MTFGGPAEESTMRVGTWIGTAMLALGLAPTALANPYITLTNESRHCTWKLVSATLTAAGAGQESKSLSQYRRTLGPKDSVQLAYPASDGSSEVYRLMDGMGRVRGSLTFDLVAQPEGRPSLLRIYYETRSDAKHLGEVQLSAEGNNLRILAPAEEDKAEAPPGTQPTPEEPLAATQQLLDEEVPIMDTTA
jgi:hypothetical protein